MLKHHRGYGNLNPTSEMYDFQHNLWDQLFMISDFKLDVDAPYPKPSPEELSERPEPLAYPQNFEVPLWQQH